MKYIVQFTTAYQHTPDPSSWTTVHPSLLIDEHTTMREVMEWVREKDASCREVRLIKVDHITRKP